MIFKKQIGGILTSNLISNKKTTNNSYWKNKIYKGPLEIKECVGDGCSKQATKDVANLYHLNYDQLDPQDAWYKKSASIKNGGQEVYNPQTNNLKSIYGKLKIGDFVSLDRPGEDHALDKSKVPGYTLKDNDKTEHVGYIVGFNDKGTPLIKHGHESNPIASAKSYVQPIDSDINLPDLGLHYKIKSIYRSKKLLENNEIKDNKYYNEVLPTKNLIFHKSANVTKDKQKFIDAYNNNAQAFQTESNLSPDEVAAIGNVAYGIFGNESKFNESNWRIPKQLGAELAYAFGLKDSSPSIGPTQLKYKDIKKNKDRSLTKTGSMMDTLNVTSGKLSNYTGVNYDAVSKATFANLVNNYKVLKSNPKFKFNSENNTVLGNVPMAYALAKTWQNPKLRNVTKALQENNSDYSKSVYKNMSELEGNMFPINLKEVVVK